MWTTQYKMRKNVSSVINVVVVLLFPFCFSCVSWLEFCFHKINDMTEYSNYNLLSNWLNDRIHGNNCSKDVEKCVASYRIIRLFNMSFVSFSVFLLIWFYVRKMDFPALVTKCILFIITILQKTTCCCHVNQGLK